MAKTTTLKIPTELIESSDGRLFHPLPRLHVTLVVPSFRHETSSSIV
jgi:hypothetical protein